MEEYKNKMKVGAKKQVIWSVKKLETVPNNVCFLPSPK